MDIAFIHPSAPSAEGTGATHSADQIINHIAGRTHDVTVYSTTEIDNQERPDTYDVKELDIKRGVVYNFSEELNKAITRRESELGKYDIVHSYLMRSIPSMGQLGINTQTSPIVTLNAFGGICPRNDLLYLNENSCERNGLLKCATCSMHESLTINRKAQNSYPWEILRVGNNLTRRMRNYRSIKKGYEYINGIEHFQALSPHVKERYVTFGYPAENISVIPNIVDTHFEVTHMSDFKEPFEILFVGTLQHRKGVDRLIDVAQELHESSESQFHLSIVGDGHLRSSLEKETKKKNLSNIITFHGHIPYNQLPTMYSKHDLFLYPGRWDEPFGRVFLEAMSAGTPIFSTDVGSVDNIIGDCGQTVQYTSAEEFSQSLDSLLDQDTLESYADQTSSQLKQYSPRNVTEKFIEMYGDI